MKIKIEHTWCNEAGVSYCHLKDYHEVPEHCQEFFYRWAHLPNKRQGDPRNGIGRIAIYKYSNNANESFVRLLAHWNAGKQFKGTDVTWVYGPVV